jgi:hypothetical protein
MIESDCVVLVEVTLLVIKGVLVVAAARPPCCSLLTTAVAAKDLLESRPLLSSFQEMDSNGDCNDVLKARIESLDLKSALELIDMTFILINSAMSMQFWRL